jgi:hypothetical protein
MEIPFWPVIRGREEGIVCLTKEGCERGKIWLIHV